MYRALICYSTKIENNIKELIYTSLSEDDAVRDALAFSYEFIKNVSDANLTFIKIYDYFAPNISPDGILFGHKAELLFRWDFRNEKALDKFLKNLRNKKKKKNDFFDDFFGFLDFDKDGL